MSRSPVARNYAEALFELARREEAVDEYGALLSEVSGLYQEEGDARRFLETPRVEVPEKKDALRRALGGEVPEPFLRFLLVVLEKGRQRRLPEIGAAYRDLVDEVEGRVHARVLLAAEPDDGLRDVIRRELEELLGKEVVPHFRVREEIVGGIVVRVEDHIMDGSLRRRLEDLRRRLLETVDEGSAGALLTGA